MSEESLEALGNAITVMVQKSDDYLVSAGSKLAEARRRIQAGEGGVTFARFLAEHCGGLSKSRAYELIAIYEGRSTPKEVRERARRGMAASRGARSMKTTVRRARGVRNVRTRLGRTRLGRAAWPPRWRPSTR